jgi:steroid delta-isomerase-like uncharacterized protein
MGTEENKAVYRRFMDEIFNKGRLDLVDELVSQSYQLHDASPGTPQGPEAIRQVVSMFRSAFPDLNISLDELLAEGDKVAARSTMRGTHRGAIFGIEPSGKAVEVQGLTMVTIRDGRLQESWVKNDVMALMSQLGAGAPP